MSSVFMKGVLLGVILLLAAEIKIYAQCCHYQNSGQDIGTSPTFGVALGDLDGDGDQDAFTIDAYEDMEIYFNNGAGLFSLNQTIVPGGDDNSNYGVHLADLDGDNDLDAVVVPFYNSSGLKIYKNNGNGFFTLFQNISSNLGSRYAGVADVDGDDDLDVILPGWMSSEVKVFKNNGTGFFTQFSSVTLVNFGQSNDIAVGDMDGDFDIDAVVISSNAAGRLLINNGAGNLTDAGITIGDPAEGYYTAEAGDMDKDGFVDLVFGSMYNSLTVITNDGLGGFVIDSAYFSSNYDKHMKLLDYDYDGDLDVFVSTYGTKGLEVWNNTGEAKLSLCYENVSPMPETYSHGFDIGLLNNDIYFDAFMGEFGGDGDKVFFGMPSFYAINQNETICYGDSYVFPDGTLGDTTMLHISHFLTSSNCDSNIIVNLTATLVNTSVSQVQNTLSAQVTGATYQWLDCNNSFTMIPGATGQSFTPVISGSYAVEVTDDGCTDTSACVNVTVTGIRDHDSPDVRIYPVPALDKLVVEFDVPQGNSIFLLDIYGRILFRQIIPTSGKYIVPLSGVKSGYYILKVQNDNGFSKTFPVFKID